MKKLSEKKFKFTIIVQGNGERVIQWDPNQGMDNACHKASDILNEGTAIERKVWEDKGSSPPPQPGKRPELQRDTVRQFT